jgi:hypothetical protein
MKQFSNGKYLGINTFERRFEGIIVSQNRYDADFFSDWHYHENPYFAFILKGGGIENRKMVKVECTPGMLLFYSTQEKHKKKNTKLTLEISALSLRKIGLSG